MCLFFFLTFLEEVTSESEEYWTDSDSTGEEDKLFVDKNEVTTCNAASIGLCSFFSRIVAYSLLSTFIYLFKCFFFKLSRIVIQMGWTQSSIKIKIHISQGMFLNYVISPGWCSKSLSFVITLITGWVGGWVGLQKKMNLVISFRYSLWCSFFFLKLSNFFNKKEALRKKYKSCCFFVFVFFTISSNKVWDKQKLFFSWVSEKWQI